MTDADREYVGLFLQVEIQAALADAGLGDVDAAMARLDALLARFEDSQHPLTLGMLHEARAQIAHRVGRKRDYHFSMVQVDRWFRATGTPTLIAKLERLADLHRSPDTARQRPVALIRDSTDPASSSPGETAELDDLRSSRETQVSRPIKK